MGLCPRPCAHALMPTQAGASAMWGPAAFLRPWPWLSWLPLKYEHLTSTRFSGSVDNPGTPHTRTCPAHGNTHTSYVQAPPASPPPPCRCTHHQKSPCSNGLTGPSHTRKTRMRITQQPAHPAPIHTLTPNKCCHCISIVYTHKCTLPRRRSLCVALARKTLLCRAALATAPQWAARHPHLTSHITQARAHVLLTLRMHHMCAQPRFLANACTRSSHVLGQGHIGSLAVFAGSLAREWRWQMQNTVLKRTPAHLTPAIIQAHSPRTRMHLRTRNNPHTAPRHYTFSGAHTTCASSRSFISPDSPPQQTRCWDVQGLARFACRARGTHAPNASQP